MMPERIGEGTTSRGTPGRQIDEFAHEARRHSTLGTAGHLRSGHVAGCRDGRSERQLGSAACDAAREQRQRLVENLQKFDLVYSADQQRALRDLDRRINELEPARQAQYLAALRRYHNWLDELARYRAGCD